MTPSELKFILDVRGYFSRISKDEVKVRVCPFCSNEKFNLELNAPDGVYKCWACKKGGRLESLLAEWFNLDVKIPVRIRDGKREITTFTSSVPIASLESVGSAMRYLRKRGMNPYYLQRYGVGICLEKQHKFYARIVIPVLYYWSQQYGGVIGRDYIGNLPKYWADATTDIVGWRVSNRFVPHILVEGPFDGIAVHLAGFNVAFLQGKGDKADTKAKLWAAAVPFAAPLGIMLDGDASDEALRLWWTLSTIRPDIKLLQLPAVMDPAVIPTDALRKFIGVHMANHTAPTYT